MKKFLIAAVFAVSGSAHAADIVYDHALEAPVAPSAAHVFSWEGAYVGTQIGYAKGKAMVVPGSTFKDSAVAYGGFAGFNFDIGNRLIAGVEAGIAETHLNARVGATAFRTDWTYDVSARLGYVFDHTLVYGSVGYGSQEIRTRIPGLANKGRSDGYVYGVGIDHALTDNIFTRVNYQYRDFGSQILNTTTGAKVGKIDLDQHFVGVGIGYKF